MILSTRGPVQPYAYRLLTALIAFAVHGYGASVQLANAPDNNLALSLKAIKAAKKSLRMNAYELSAPEIVSALNEKIDAGVLVQILEEGQPVGGFSSASKKAMDDIVKRMAKSKAHAENQFYVMKAPSEEAAAKRRYRYDHAKYIIVDDKELLVGSENYTSTGHPTSGKKGNRGWEVYITDKNIASQFYEMFAEDSSEDYGDIEPQLQSRVFEAPFHFMTLLDSAALAGLEASPFVDATTTGPKFEIEQIDVIASPTTSEEGLIELLDSAETSIDLQLMSFNTKWDSSSPTSPLYEALLRAGRRNVSVRLLLNDEDAFGGNPASVTTNETSRDKLNDVAKKEKLPIRSKIANIKGMGVTYIHNKGVLVDGTKTLISSINWNQNSVKNNRETAVVLNSEQAASYYSALFEADWSK